MRWSIVSTIFWKELRETLRDRRTLFAMFVLPVLIHPLMFLLLGKLSAVENQARKSLEPSVVVWGPLPAETQDALEKQIGLKILERKDAIPPDAEREARALIESKRVELVLGVAADVPALVARDGSGELEVWYDSINNRSDSAETRLRGVLSKWNETQLAARLQRHGLPASFTHPLTVKSADLSSKAKRGADLAGRALPIVLLFVMITCGMLAAIDLTAGEKERGTLQTLLCAPIHPIEIVAGKYLTVVLVAVIGAMANLVAMIFALSRQFAALSEHIELGFHFSTALLVFVTMLPGAFFLSALLLAMAVFARSFREAQSYLTPILLLVLLPAMVSFLPGVELTPATALVPVCNMALLVRQLMTGRASVEMFFVVTVANLAYSAAAILLASRVFETEQVLLSGEKPWRDVFGRRGRVHATPTPGSAVMFVVVLLVLVYYGSLWADPQRVGVLGMLAVTQLGLMLLPALAWTRLLRLDARATFSLRWPTLRGWAGALLLAVSLWAVGGMAAKVLLHFFEGAREYNDTLKALFSAQGGAVLAAIAILPAIAEEACFRGVVLSGLSNSGSRWVAIGGSALAFGLMHLNPFHMIVASLMGALLGFATLESGSILAGALAHLVNNALGMLSVRYAAVGSVMESTPALAAGCMVALVALSILRNSRRQ